MCESCSCQPEESTFIVGEAIRSLLEMACNGDAVSYEVYAGMITVFYRDRPVMKLTTEMLVDIYQMGILPMVVTHGLLANARRVDSDQAPLAFRVTRERSSDVNGVGFSVELIEGRPIQ